MEALSQLRSISPIGPPWLIHFQAMISDLFSITRSWSWLVLHGILKRTDKATRKKFQHIILLRNIGLWFFFLSASSLVQQHGTKSLRRQPCFETSVSARLRIGNRDATAVLAAAWTVELKSNAVLHWLEQTRAGLGSCAEKKRELQRCATT